MRYEIIMLLVRLVREGYITSFHVTKDRIYISKLLFPSTKYLPTPGTDGSGTEILCDVIFELFGGVCGSDRCG